MIQVPPTSEVTVTVLASLVWATITASPTACPLTLHHRLLHPLHLSLLRRRAAGAAPPTRGSHCAWGWRNKALCDRPGREEASAYTHVHIQACVYTLVCINVCVCVCEHVYIHTCVCLLYIYTCLYIYVYIYIYIYI